MKMNFIGSLCLILLVSACGGGGGGGGDKTATSVRSTTNTSTSSSSIATTTLTANAGADITVNEGETVNLDPSAVVVNPSSFTNNAAKLEITGASTNVSDVVKITWTRETGTAPSALTLIGGTYTGKFSFIAPDTGTADSIQIVYQLVLTNAAGQTASDSITITVNRVNTTPIAAAGDDQNIESDSVVTLTATASNDSDGTISTYAWTQTSGDSIVLMDADKAIATFTAPTVLASTEYEFQVTVTDNNGATATDKIIVVVTPIDAPIVNIYFPTPVGVYKESTISAFGSAEAVNANLLKVEVSTGTDFTEATLSDGKWRLDNIAVPATDTFEIIVKVTDSLGKISIKKSSLKKSGAQGSGQSWTKIIALGIDNENQRVLAFASGTLLSHIRVFPIALLSGNRGVDVSNFGNATQGVQTYVIAQAHYDALAHSFYYTLNPVDMTLKVQLNEINVSTGQRKIISENSQTLMSPPASSFISPVGLTSNQQGQVFIADNGSGKVIRVELSNGVRTVIGSASGAIDVAMDPSQTNSLFLLPYAANSFVSKVLLDVNPVTSSIVTDSDISTQGPVITRSEQIEVDTSLNKLFLVDESNQLFEADITTGTRTKIESVSVAGKGYDHERHLFYYNDKTKNAIWVLDPVSKHKVMLSGSVD